MEAGEGTKRRRWASSIVGKEVLKAQDYQRDAYYQKQKERDTPTPESSEQTQDSNTVDHARCPSARSTT